MKLNLIILLLTLVIYACSEKEKLNIYEKTLSNKKSIIRKIREITIQEDSTTFIGRFRVAKFYRGKLVVADILTPALYFINSADGNIVKEISWTKGKGPGEISRIANFEILDDKIYISDMGNLRWSIYDSTGKFLESKRPFQDLQSKNSGKYAENCNIIESNNKKLFVCIIEHKYNREYQQNNSKSIAILDSDLSTIKIFGFMDKIYSKYNIFMPYPSLAIDKKGFIYFSQEPTYKIYKYDSNGIFIKAFGVKSDFRMIDSNLPLFISRQEANKKSKEFSHTLSLFTTKENFILHQYSNLNDDFYKSKSVLDREHFLKVYDNLENYIPSDIKLPGLILAVENNDIFIYINDEPFNKKVGIYRIEIIEN